MLLSFQNAVPLLGLAVALTLATMIVQGLRNPLRHIPGPCISSFTNLRLKLAVVTGQRIHYVHALHERYGSFVRIAPNEVAVNDPQAFQHIYSVKAGLEKNRWYHDVSGSDDRPVLFTMRDTKSHAARRKVFSRSFSKTHTRQHWEAHIKQRVDLTVSKIRSEAAKLGSADILKWWTLMASDVSSHLMFGESFHTLEQGEMNEFMRYLTKALVGGAIGSEIPLVKTIGQYLPFQATRELFNTNSFLADYAEIAVRNMKAQQGNTNLFATAQAEAEKGQSLTDKDVRLEAIALFVAGTDTTAVSLTYLVWAVISHPHLREQLEKEVTTLPEGYLDADVETLPLLNAVIEETLRLYGAAPGALPRDVPAGGLELGRYYIPQGNIVSTQAFTLHRDPTLWTDPLEFKPSRWIDADGSGRGGKVSAAAKAVFNPFGSGSRGCVGQHIALSELRLATAEFFRQCPGARLAPSTTPESMGLENFFLIAPKAHRCEIVV